MQALNFRNACIRLISAQARGVYHGESSRLMKSGARPAVVIERAILRSRRWQPVANRGNRALHMRGQEGAEIETRSLRALPSLALPGLVLVKKDCRATCQTTWAISGVTVMPCPWLAMPCLTLNAPTASRRISLPFHPFHDAFFSSFFSEACHAPI
jgi:hypothetical protein